MTTLPFKNAKKPETVEISDPVLGTLEFPKLYSVTFNEEAEIIRVLMGAPQETKEEIKKQPEAAKGSYVAQLYSTNVGLATVALRRLEPGWTEAQTKELPQPLINKVSGYILDERNGWKTPDPVALGEPSTGTTTPAKSKKATAKSTGGLIDVSPAMTAGDGTTSATSS